MFHTFLEALQRLKQNGVTLSVKDFISFPAEKQKRKDFYKCCAVICTFFLEKNHFATLPFNKGDKIEYSISSTKLVMVFGPANDRKTLTVHGGE
jgi:hypothetical protein